MSRERAECSRGCGWDRVGGFGKVGSGGRGEGGAGGKERFKVRGLIYVWCSVSAMVRVERKKAAFGAGRGGGKQAAAWMDIERE